MSSATVSESAALLKVQQVAELLGCSVRHIYRLADRGAMPRPVRLGDVLVRWNRRTGDPSTGIEDWIAGGCKSIRAVAKGGAR
jgi:excisionase family DNA binding protein